MLADQAPMLKSANATDSAAIRDLVRAAYAKWIPVIGREPGPMQADYDQHLKIHRFDLLVEDVTLVALVETQVRTDHLWIENVAVHPDHQGKGYGTCLLAHAEKLARLAGLSELRLLTDAAFATNLVLYVRLGYRTTHTEPFRNGTTLYMSKRLTD